MKVSVCPLRFGSVPLILHDCWHHYRKREQLIDWDLAKAWFVKPAFAIDLTKQPPVIGPIEILEV